MCRHGGYWGLDPADVESHMRQVHVDEGRTAGADT